MTTLTHIDLDELNEPCKQKRLKAVKEANLSTDDFEVVGDYVVITCPKCEKGAAVWFETSDGLPDRIDGNCDNCGYELIVGVEWETVSQIVHADVQD